VLKGPTRNLRPGGDRLFGAVATIPKSADLQG
jgi:hypothetical protein